MNRITPEKRNQLIMVGLVILAVIAGLYFGLIRYQQQKLRELVAKRETANTKLAQIADTKTSGGKIEAELAEVSDQLAVKETDMASDDLYAWMVNFIRKFKVPYKVEIKQFNSKGTSDMTLLPRFPYKQITVTLMGSAYYHELGRFVADFENNYPSSRIVNLELAPEASQAPEDRERLTFKMDVVALVKTSSAH